MPKISRRDTLKAAASAAGLMGGLEIAALREALAQATPPRGGTLRVVLTGNVGTLDPHNSGIAVDRQPQMQIFETLVGLGPDLSIRPGLAESWEVRNPTTLVMNLRRGVKFHDGTAFDAEAVKWNFDRVLNPENKLAARVNINNIKAVDVLGSHQVRLTLQRPDSSIFARLSERPGMMMSPAAARKAGADVAFNPVGTGPFAFVRWVKDNSITLRRNPDYWDKGFPLLDGIQFKIVREGAQQILEISTRNAEIVDFVEPKDAKVLRSNPDVSVLGGPSLQYLALFVNVSKPPLDDKRVRQALSWAINRQAIVDVAYLGDALVAQSPFPPAFPLIHEPSPPGAYTLNVARARELLAAAGKPNLAFTLNVGTSALATQAAELLKQQFAAVGVNMTIRQLDVTQMVKEALSRRDDATMFTFSGRIDPDYQVYEAFVTGGALNYGGYANPEMDRLLNAGRSEYDPAKRAAIYKSVNRILLEDLPRIYIAYPKISVAVRKAVVGFTAIPDYVLRLGQVGLQPR